MKSLFTLLVLMLAGGLVVTPVLAAEPATQKAKPAAKDAANSQYPHSGKVLSIIDTELYVYIEVAGKTDKDESIWLAATRTKVEKGDNIRYGEGAPMHNFFSPTLKKTFPTIVFLEKVEVIK